MGKPDLHLSNRSSARMHTGTLRPVAENPRTPFFSPQPRLASHSHAHTHPICHLPHVPLFRFVLGMHRLVCCDSAIKALGCCRRWGGRVEKQGVERRGGQALQLKGTGECEADRRSCNLGISQPSRPNKPRNHAQSGSGAFARFFFLIWIWRAFWSPRTSNSRLHGIIPQQTQSR